MKSSVLERSFLVVTMVAIGVACAPTSTRPDPQAVLEGPFLGQPLPGSEPVLFAPGVVSTGLNVRDVAMTPDGGEIYIGAYLGRYAYTTVLVTRLVGTRWTELEVAPFATDPTIMNIEPHISPDGSRFFFLSNRPKAPAAGPDQDIWMMEREGSAWGAPVNLGAPVDTDAPEFYPSATRDGTLYFTRQDATGSAIFRARRLGEGYAEPERLPAEVNSGQMQFNAFVAPDESYLIVSAAGREDSLGGSDYYVCYRSPDDRWSSPVHLPAPINSEAGEEFSPYVSPDGRVLFFMSTRTVTQTGAGPQRLTLRWMSEALGRPGHGNSSIWWVDAAILEQMRPS
jgi:hypothetical protein